MDKDFLDIWVRFKDIKPYCWSALTDCFDGTEDLKDSCGTPNPSSEELTTAILDKLWADRNYDVMYDLLYDVVQFHIPSEDAKTQSVERFY